MQLAWLFSLSPPASPPLTMFLGAEEGQKGGYRLAMGPVTPSNAGEKKNRVDITFLILLAWLSLPKVPFQEQRGVLSKWPLLNDGQWGTRVDVNVLPLGAAQTPRILERKGHCSGAGGGPPKKSVHKLVPEAANVTLFGRRDVADIRDVEVRSSWIVWVGPKSNNKWPSKGHTQ